MNVRDTGFKKLSSPLSSTLDWNWLNRDHECAAHQSEKKMSQSDSGSRLDSSTQIYKRNLIAHKFQPPTAISHKQKEIPKIHWCQNSLLHNDSPAGS